MTTEELFHKYSTDFYDANGAKSEVLTLKRFEKALTDLDEEAEVQIKELVEATLIIGAKRSGDNFHTTEELKPLIEQHIEGLSKRFSKLLKRA